MQREFFMIEARFLMVWKYAVAEVSYFSAEHGGEVMNERFFSVKSWFLTHQPSLWGDAILIALLSGMAITVVWEGG